MPDYTVSQHGIDTSGRPLLMTAYMADWWDRVCEALGFIPTVVQGAFMARVGGGAAASAGYHDLGGCLDLRTWDRTPEEVAKIIRITRSLGAGSWVRDHRHGMDPHIHFVLGTDYPLASGAAYQWRQYVQGRDGLASNGPDYHWRPDPLVTTPPEEDPMAAYDSEIRTLLARTERIEHKLDVSNANQREREIRLAERIAKRIGVAADRIVNAVREEHAAEDEQTEG